MIQQISFEEILPIWSNYLWPNRKSAIEPTSAMNYLGGYDLENMKYEPIFLAYKSYDRIIGVNSGHMCINNSYRSRGLYVFPEFRGNKIGIKLLKATIEQGCKKYADFCWSYPKFSSWSTYKNAGFELSSSWGQSELDTNAYCIQQL